MVYHDEKYPPSEIQALITLLGDDDAKIRNVARKHLLDFGEEAEEYLKEATTADLDGRIRIEARHVLNKIRHDDFISSFSLLGLLKGSQIDLEHSVFLLARVGYPDLDIHVSHQILDEMAAKIQHRIKNFNRQKDGYSIIKEMNKFLYTEYGFSGNVDEYYEPDNSYINKVLEIRTGIPVSLSVIYLLLAKRLKLPIQGISMPLHFICKYQMPTKTFFIDPFHNGRILTQAECMMMLHGAGYTFHENFLTPVDARVILIRMLRNLTLIYYQREDTKKVKLLEYLLKILKVSL